MLVTMQSTRPTTSTKAEKAGVSIVAATAAEKRFLSGAVVASLGGTASRDHRGRYRKVVRHARAAVLLAAGAEGIAAIDAVHLAIDDLDGLRAEAEDAAASGFAATACIHPSHVAVIRDAYRPTPAEVTAARRLLDAAATGGAVFQHEGRMIDGPVLRHAEAVLRRASVVE